MPRYDIKSVEYAPTTGTHIDMAIGKACSLAMEFGSTILFEFNGEHYKVKPNDVRDAAVLQQQGSK